jgi:hypothetical protein
MSIEDILIEEAKYQAERMQSTRPALEAELLEIEKRKAKIEADLNALNLAHKRLLNYRPRIGPNLHCPRCGVQKEIGSSLRAIPTSGKDDILRCNTCGLDVLIPSR